MQIPAWAAKVKTNDEYDVIVAGGGPAGSAAATTAAERGARTLLIEMTGSLGGLGTTGLVTIFWGITDGKRLIYGGFFERLARRYFQDRFDPFKTIAYLAEPMKVVYDRIAVESGAHVRFFSLLAGADVADGVVKEILVADKGGLTAYRAPKFIDATGDGDLAVMAGAAYEKGDAAGQMQPASPGFLLAGVDSARAYENLDEWRPKLLERIAAAGFTGIAAGSLVAGRDEGNGIHRLNQYHLWGVDQTDPENLSRHMIEARQFAVVIRDALRECHPDGFASAEIVTTAALPGTRETRRIKGEYVLTTDDWHARAKFPDQIALNSFYLDVHPTRAEQERRDRPAPDAGRAVKRRPVYGPGETMGIPYRCLVPVGLKNVIVAGRCLSSDRGANGAVRVMAPCMAMGEAAGVAATIGGADFNSVDVDELRAILKQRGAVLT